MTGARYSKFCRWCKKSTPWIYHGDGIAECLECGMFGDDPIHLKANDESETAPQITTVEQLRELLADVPADTPVFIRAGGWLYNLCAEYRTQDEIAHSGKSRTVKGVFIEID